MAAPIQMTTDQLQELIRALQQSSRLEMLSPSTQYGNFSRCTSRFDGASGSNVETFIDAISAYKDCADISDENALRGLPMLLIGLAAEWWAGVKDSTPTFDEAITNLRTAFGTKKPAYKIYRELFEKEQDATMRTDIFICKCRALLAQLPPPVLAHSVQLDMVYGLLNSNIRERVRREEIKTFDDLLRLARIAEEHIPTPEKNCRTILETTVTKKLRPRCSYCRNFGHDESACKKLATRRDDEAKEKKPTVSCYGCGTPGVIRSKCSNCQKTNTGNGSSAGFCSLKTLTMKVKPRARPIFRVEILGVSGTGYVDTAAQQSVASRSLYVLLVSKGQKFENIKLTTTLADGASRSEDVLVTTIAVKLQNRCIDTTFIVFPYATNNTTLFGADFLHDAEIVLNIAQRVWYFADSPQYTYELTQEMMPVTKASASISCISSLRSDEGATLSSEQRKRLNSFIDRNKDIFGQEGGPTPFAEHTISVQNHQSIALPPYKMSTQKKILLQNEINSMLEKGIIEECESPWAAPVVLVPKKDGTTRLCVDYRRLNAITVTDSYPLPRIDDLLHDTGNNVYLSTLDLRSGYYQVAMSKTDRDKTAFVTPFGTYRFLRMPMGLKNSGATFQRLMDKFRQGLKDTKVLVYLDDLIVLSKDFDTHIKDLNNVFTRLRLFKLSANRGKCTFCKTQVKYLGHVITTQGVATDPDKIAAIVDMTAPRNVKQVRTFMQTCSWYRRYVPNFAKVAKPLSDLTKKDAPWKWEQPQRDAYNSLKKALTTAPVLRQADPTLPYTIRTDASKYALGAVLLQGEGADERPVEYASRLLTPAERNYHTTEREALAVVYAVKKFRGYIDGAKITVETDHQALRWLMKLNTPAGRLARWALLLQEYDLTINYTPGKRNVVADTLSRPPCCEELESGCELCTFAVDMPARKPNQIRQGQLEDSELAKIIHSLEEPDHTDAPSWRARNYLILDGILYRYVPEANSEEALLVVPAAERKRILEEYHDAPTAGHYGAEKTYQKLANKYYWPGMRRHIEEYVKFCADCQRYKSSNLKPVGLLRTPVMNQRFESIAIDLFGPLPTTANGEKWVFIVEDIASRWIELFPMKEATAYTCARLLIDEVFLRYGIPRRITSDNGVQFVSAVMQQTAHCFGIEQTTTPLYHPQANPVERRNRELKTQLAILLKDDHTKWSAKLPAIRFSINTCVCQSTGQTPAYLTYGRELRTLVDVQHDVRNVVVNETLHTSIIPHLKAMTGTLQEARELHEASQDRRKVYADSKRRPAPVYKEGDNVWVRTHILSDTTKGLCSKFVPRRDGPYKVHARYGDVYEVVAANRPSAPLGRYHVSALTKYNGGRIEKQTPLVPIRRRGRPRREKNKPDDYTPSKNTPPT